MYVKCTKNYNGNFTDKRKRQTFFQQFLDIFQTFLVDFFNFLYVYFIREEN